MPISTPTLATRFGADYPKCGAYVTDTERFPFYNPPDSGVMYLPCEPISVVRDGVLYSCVTQGRILPGETGYVVRRYTVDLPCDLSADVAEGTAIFWEPSNTTADYPAGRAGLEADVTNGFLVGYATYAYSKTVAPTLDGDDKVICGDEDSTIIRVTSFEGISRGLGTFEVDAS